MRRLLLSLMILFMVRISISSIAAQDGSVPCPGLLPTRLAIGMDARITPGDPNNLRVGASVNSDIHTQISGGTSIFIMGGPVCADGFVWWQVNYDGLIGWTVEATATEYWIEPATTSSTSTQSIIDNLLIEFNIAESITVEAVSDPYGRGDFVEIKFINSLVPPPEGYQSSGITIIPLEQWDGDISMLQTLLDDPQNAPVPTFLHWAEGGFVWQGAQRMTLELPHMRGFRMVNTIGLGYPAISNEGLWYVYQGLTRGEQFYIAALLPIQIPMLPDRATEDDVFWMGPEMAFSEKLYNGYIDSITAMLDTAPNYLYDPCLSYLDAIMASLHVGETVPGTSTPFTQIDIFECAVSG